MKKLRCSEEDRGQMKPGINIPESPKRDGLEKRQKVRNE